MKIRLFFLGPILMLMSLTSSAQGDRLDNEARERIESQRIAFITLKLSLTPDEAQKFWPIYNEHKEQLKDLKDDFERPDIMNVTDAEANGIIDRHLQMEQKRLDLKRNLITKLRTVISPAKILRLQAAEREFNRDLLKKANDFRMNYRGKN